MTLPSAEKAHQFALILTFLAFLVLTGLLVVQNLWLQELVVDERSKREEAEARAMLDAWEGIQRGRIEDAVARAARDPRAFAADPPAPFLAAFLWQAGTGPEAPADFLLPQDAPADDLPLLQADPCLRKAAQDPTPDTPRVEIAAAWLACRDRPLPVASLATSRAVDQLLLDGRPGEALQALQALAERAAATPTDAAPIALERSITLRLQRAQALRSLRLDLQATEELVQAAGLILASPTPELDQLLTFIDYPILADLREMGQAELADGIAARADIGRRVQAAWREARRLADSGEPSPGNPIGRQTVLVAGVPTTVEVRSLSDSLGRRRFVLVTVALPSDRHLALVLNPAVMLDELITSGRSRRPVVLDGQGNVLLPEDARLAPARPLPLSLLMPELRMGLQREAFDEHPKGESLWALALPWMLLSLGAALGTLSLVAWRRAERQRNELWQRQQAFVNRVSHELKTPLAGMKSMTGILDMGLVTEPEEVRQCAQRMMTEISRLEDRVNEILRYARRPQIMRAEELDICTMAEDLVEAWEPRFEQIGVILTTDLGPTAPVMADRELIRDAFNNLLDNAWKYLREDRPGLVSVRTGTTDAWAWFEVADNGYGVPEPMRRAIFERFTRVEGPDRGKAGGHGLGLAFVDEAVGSHGGKVECRDGINGGALFVIRLRRTR